MIKISQDDIDKARALIAHGTPEAVGYRILIKPIDVSTGMENAEVEKFEHLARMGFESKTDSEADRQSKGTQHGILVHAGDGAFKGDLEKLGNVWVKEGDVVIFDRYCGVEMELPPGSGDKFRFTNDESILGKMV
jgi:co-chaperonin GroES (HSP10)